MSKIVDYYLHPISPWSFLGHGRLCEILAAHGAQVRVKPIDLGNRVFPVSGGVPLPKRAPQRQAYRLVELERWARLRAEPLILQPKFFPVPCDDACRLIIAADLCQGADAAMRLAGALMRAVWCEQRDISDADTQRAIARACGLEFGALAHRLPDAHQPFDAYTQEAIERGVFGVPWYVYRGEPFWGQDRLDFLARKLAK